MEEVVFIIFLHLFLGPKINMDVHSAPAIQLEIIRLRNGGYERQRKIFSLRPDAMMVIKVYRTFYHQRDWYLSFLAMDSSLDGII